MEGSKMSNNSIDVAKQIFLKYDGSHFHMERDGKYELYKGYNISEEQEILWIQEYQEELLKKLENESVATPTFMKLCRMIKHYKDLNVLISLIDFIENKKETVDSFTKMRMAEEIIKIHETIKDSMVTNDKVLFIMKNLASQLLTDLLKQPITVASYYYVLDYLKEEIKEDSIKDRARRKLSKLEK